jgi:tRNA pseudouridine55 synthase
MNKPLGWTSADVVRKVRFLLQRRWLLKRIKVGHAGTLDPLATGLLIICVGKATQLANYFQEQEKEYVAEIMFGATTPSHDLEHPIDFTYPWEHIDFTRLEKTLDGFLGEQQQMPPVFSAKIIDGTRAYELARQGNTPQMKEHTICIRSLKIVAYAPPRLTLKINCSKGTYIRSLARDLGEALESGAHLVSLHRSKSGPYTADDAMSIEDFEVFIRNETKNTTV